MFLQVFTETDKEKLTLSGYAYICTKSVNGQEVHIFENNKSMKFNDLGVKAIPTNKLYF